MLQIALLLLGCALTRYLWKISRTIALVVLVITSFGLLFYICILVAGSVSDSCPYQTPWITFHSLRGAKSLENSSFSSLSILEESYAVGFVTNQWNRHFLWWSWADLIGVAVALPLWVPILLAAAVRRLAWVTLKALAALTI